MDEQPAALSFDEAFAEVFGSGEDNKQKPKETEQQ